MTNLPPADRPDPGPIPPLSRLPEAIFGLHGFDPNEDALYRDLVDRMCREVQARPGFTIAHELLIERIAHRFISLKRFDSPTLGAIPDPLDYDRSDKQLTEQFKALFAEGRLAREEHLDVHVQRVAIQKSMDAAFAVIDAAAEAGTLTRGDADDMKRVYGDSLARAYDELGV